MAQQIQRLQQENDASYQLLNQLQEAHKLSQVRQVFKLINSRYRPSHPLQATNYMSNEERLYERETARRIIMQDLDKNDTYIRATEARQEIFDEIVTYYENRPKGQQLVIKFGDTYWTITHQVLLNLEEYIDHLTAPSKVTQYGSDVDFKAIFFGDPPSLADCELLYIDFKTKSPKSNEGGFFGYVNTTKVNLNTLQIYTEEQLDRAATSKDPKDRQLKNKVNTDCLLYAIQSSGVVDQSLELTKHEIIANQSTTFNGGIKYLPKRKLKEVANVLKCAIRLKDIGTNYKIRYTLYGAEYIDKLKMQDNTIRLALFLDHYFLDCQLSYTNYSVKNYQTVKDLDKWECIVSNTSRIKRNKNSRIVNSATAVIALHQQGLFKRKIVLERFVDHSIDHANFIIPKTIDQYFTPFDKPERVLKKEKVFFFDIECTTNEKYHNAFLFGFTDLDRPDVMITKTIYEMLDTMNDLTPLKRTIVLYAHNAKYDYSAGFRDIMKTGELIKDGQFYSSTFIYKKRNFIIKDTYKHITIPLSKFRSVYNLNIGKKDEFMPYDLYTTESIDKFRIPLELVTSHPNYVEAKHKPLIEPYILDKTYFKHMDYMREYLKYDVLTLRAGFLKQKEAMKKVTGLNIFEFLTLSSLADYYFSSQKSYDGVNQVHGALKTWIMRSVIGGRVATRQNQKHNIHKRIMDFDAVSLYPSAISLLKTPLGTPTVITEIPKDDQGYYIAEITITEVGKERDLPFMCYQDESGGRCWTNDMIGQRVVVDRVTLEDYIQFHKIKYEFHQGISWSNFSTTFAEQMKELFKKRLEAKTNMKLHPEKRDYYNMIQLCIKLIMNCSYGKNIMKESITKVVFKPIDQGHRYLVKNFHQIIKYNIEKLYYRFTIRSNAFNQGNRAHVGTNILSVSKRIMNEVMGTAEDEGIEILYQDTDSMHLPLVDVNKLSETYDKKYNRVLIGREMLQFHNDLENSKGEPCTSVHCIILGKKCYIDKILPNRLLDKTEPDEKDYEYHIRMKGVGSKTVLANYSDPMKVYERMYNGEALDFDLLKCGVSFKIDSGMTVESKTKFIRRLQFGERTPLMSDELYDILSD